MDDPHAAARTTTVIVMGVSGSGKSTVAADLVDQLGWTFAEGDDFHPRANVEKMRSGTPLNDDDRWPWLDTIASWIGEREVAGENSVVTCSALKHVYRDVLRRGHESVWFVHVTASAELIQERLAKRKGHYMPASLLDSQLATLEPLGPGEPGITVSAAGSPHELASVVLAALDLDPHDRAPKTGGTP